MLRILKIAIAAGLLLLSLWALLLPPYFPSSAHSVVNARKITIDTLSEGTISGLAEELHAPVEKEQIIATVQREQREVLRELDQMKFLHNRLQTQLENTKLLLTQREGSLNKAVSEYQRRQASDIAVLKQKLATTEAQLITYQKNLEIVQEDGQRIKELLDDGIITKSQWSEHQQRVIEAEEKLRRTQDMSVALQKNLTDTQAGLYQSASETTDGLSSEIAILQSEIRSLSVEKNNLKTQLKEASEQIKNTQHYLSSDEFQPIKSPIRGIIWQKYAINGETVQSGRIIAELADENSIFVEAYFNRHYQENISYGDYAHILLTSESRYIEGIVVDIQVQEEFSESSNIINAIAPNKEMLRILIRVEPDSLQTTHIGQLAQVVISSADPGIIQKSLIGLSFMLRNHK